MRERIYEFIQDYPVLIFIIWMGIFSIIAGTFSCINNMESHDYQLSMAKLGMVQDKDGHWIKGK